MADEPRQRRRRLGEILVAGGVLDERQLEDALAAQQSHGRHERLGAVVLRLGFCTEQDVAHALAGQLGYDTVNLAVERFDSEAIGRVPRRLAERHEALPLRVEDNDVLIVAMADPTNVVAFDDLKLTAGVRAVRPVVATSTDLRDALRHAYGGDQAAKEMVETLHGSDVVTVDDEDTAEDLSSLAEQAGDQPVIRLANAILSDAVRERASDVHVEPRRDGVAVRYRVDGMLREKMVVPRNLGPSLVSRLKIMSQLDIAERRRPQDGRSVVRVEGQEVDLRVSTMPTLFGETIVLRLLRKGEERLGIGDIGMASDTHAAFEQALNRPQGLIVLTGPTGSGKTTTLYAGLTELADPVRNVLTLEDPIEYQLPGVNQTQVNPKIGLTFARGLRSVLRQDPDVVMVGEIRDQETAELAMEASFTGHLVLSTLHTNDAPSTIVRLVDLGVERFLIASSVVLVVGQRLVRTICEHCKAEAEPEERIVRLLGLGPDDLEGRTLLAGMGCSFCDNSGFVGRTGVYEALVVTPQMRELIVEGASETALARLARAQGMRTLREDGLAKAFAGVTTLEEVLRVTPEESTTVHRCPACNSLVGDDFVVCPSCQEDLRTLSCQSCGSALEAQWMVCPYCNTPVGRSPLAPSTPGAPADPAPAASTAGSARSEVADDTTAAATDRSGRQEDGETPGPGHTVLVAEDDDSVRELVATALGEDHVVLEAETGGDTLEQAREHRPDALILDYHLPDIDGIEITRKLREDGATANMAIVIVTGDPDTETEVEGLIAGVDDYLHKPFEEEVLRTRLRAALRRHARGS